MKFLMLLMSFFLVGGAVELQAYQAGTPNRPQFGAQRAESEDDGENSSVPGARSRVKTRTFSNYGSRQQWGKGVETKAVQTNPAAIVQKGELTQTGATDKFSKSTPDTKADKAKDRLKTGKKAPKQEEKKGNAKGADTAAKAAQPAEAAMPAEMANVMQQMQGMQEMMKMMGGGAGAPAGGAKGGAAAGMPAGMNIPGMPDMSALMNAAAAGQQPAQK